MFNTIVRTHDEIEDVYDKAMTEKANGSKWPGMTYEEGVIAMLEWLTGQRDESPMED